MATPALTSRPLRALVLVAVGAVLGLEVLGYLWASGSAHGAGFAAPRAAPAPGARAPSWAGRRAPPAGGPARRAAAGVATVARPQAGVEAPTAGAIAAWGLAALAATGGAAGAAWGAKAALQCVAGVAGLYAIMSVNEYVVHRYYQHLGLNRTAAFRWLRKQLGLPNLRTTGHVEHHKETLDDMSLDVRADPILDQDPYRGTAFSWSVSAVMTIEIAVQSYPWLWLCGWSLSASTAALFVAMALHLAAWQTLHPNMHELPDPGWGYGIPGWSMKWLRKTGYFRFLYVNHEGHHRAPGAHGNYNVCCPLADHLFGTYVGVLPPQAAHA